jgi:hypothetical protein
MFMYLLHHMFACQEQKMGCSWGGEEVNVYVIVTHICLASKE